MNKQFYVMYFKELDTLIIQVAPLHDTNHNVMLNPNGVTTVTHSTRWIGPNGVPEVVGFTVQNVSLDVSMLSLLNLVGPGLGVDMATLAAELILVESKIKQNDF